MLSLLVAGCVSIPKGRAVTNAVKLRGSTGVASSDIKDKLATRPSPRFLGVFSGVVYEYEVFSRLVLERDLERVERYLRARGYYKARARAGRVRYIDPRHVRVEIVVEAGPPTLIRGVVVRGLDSVTPAVAAAVRRALEREVQVGERFEEESFSSAERAMQRALTDRGYAYANVIRTAQVDVVNDLAMLAFDVDPDRPAVFGAVRFEGLDAIPEAPIRRTVNIAQGRTYSTAAIRSAEQALLELGVFSSVRVAPDLAEPRPDPRVIPIVVRVEEAKLRSVRVGFGLQLDSLRTDLHVLGGWETKSLFGGLRSLSAELRPGVVLYPTRVTDLQAPERLLPEERMRVRFRQPGFIESRTNALLRLEVNTSPVLLSTEVDPDVPVLGYLEFVGSAGLDRTFWRHLYVNASLNVQENRPFAYTGMLDPDLRPLLVSFPELVATLDWRDDPLDPRRGVYLSNDLQVAGLGGDAQDLRVQPDVRAYIPLARQVSFGLRATTGLLFPFNYGPPDPAGPRREWVRDSQILFFRGFFSGGSTSNRGYATRGVGPHGIVPFFTPGIASELVRNECDDPDADPARCLLPTGGFTLWEASAELRYRITGPLTGATFCDASDVAPGRVEYRFDRPHLSCGPGLRYDTPVGPIRADVGFRIPGLQVLSDERDGEGQPPELFGSIPAALSIGIGEAF